MNHTDELLLELLNPVANLVSSQELNMIKASFLRSLSKYDIILKESTKDLPATVEDYNAYLLQQYTMHKSLSGASQKSLRQFLRETRKCLITLDKKATEITSQDLEYYLLSYKYTHGISNTSLQNMRAYINNFFIF